MKKFILKLLLFISPALIVVILYLYLDPFKVLRHYDSYYISGRPTYVTPNRDYISTENWLNYYPKYQYDSYIFGNSRSIYYEISTWKKYIHKPIDKCYHFDASGESLYGIVNKIKLLDKKNAPIDNAMIVLDYTTLKVTVNNVEHLNIKHPILSNQNPVKYQLEFFKAFLDYKFLSAYLDFVWSGEVKDYMKKDFLLNDIPIDYNNVTNEIRFSVFEDMISKKSDDFYGPRRKIFYNRDNVQSVSPVTIGLVQRGMLNEIQTILNKKGTKYKIIINPMYDQKELNPVDYKCLCDIFGKDNVFNFSGVNQFTKDYTNYYETSHYRPKVANEIMNLIYQ